MKKRKFFHMGMVLQYWFLSSMNTKKNLHGEEECKAVFTSFPDYMNATYDENIVNRQQAIKEYVFYIEIGKKEKAKKIKTQYNL